MFSKCPNCNNKLIYIRRSKRKKITATVYEFDCDNCQVLLEKNLSFKQVIISLLGPPIIFSIFDMRLGRDVIENNVVLVTAVFVLLTLLFWVVYEDYNVVEGTNTRTGTL